MGSLEVLERDKSAVAYQEGDKDSGSLGHCAYSCYPGQEKCVRELPADLAPHGPLTFRRRLSVASNVCRAGACRLGNGLVVQRSRISRMTRARILYSRAG